MMDAPSSPWKQRLQVLHKHLTLTDNADHAHVQRLKCSAGAEPSVWHDVPQVLRLSKPFPTFRL